jgi:hypothetical protein
MLFEALAAEVNLSSIHNLSTQRAQRKSWRINDIGTLTMQISPSIAMPSKIRQDFLRVKFAAQMSHQGKAAEKNFISN